MGSLSASIPSPSANGFHLGPLLVHYYGLCYGVAILAAVLLTRRLWRARGGEVDLVVEVAIVGVPAGVLGGRLYHDLTSWNTVPHNWWGWLAVWEGGLGIWGGIAAGAGAGVLLLRRRRVDVAAFLDAAAPGLLVAQAIGRLGNYFNQELFGAPSRLPWALQISPAHRPDAYLADATFQPTFLYELLWNVLLAGALVALARRVRVRPPGIFALYVAGYSAFRILEELLRVDPAHHVLGMRLNFWVAIAALALGGAWFARTQRPRPAALGRRLGTPTPDALPPR
jgi:prolipoprotein diacylglyceryl transferase